jgi:hypothetical protein
MFSEILVRTIARNRPRCYNRVRSVETMGTASSRKRFAIHAEIVWVKRENFVGWACSQCAWEFTPSKIPAGNTIAEIKQSYERERDKEFASHVCAKHLREKSAGTKGLNSSGGEQRK